MSDGVVSSRSWVSYSKIYLLTSASLSYVWLVWSLDAFVASVEFAVVSVRVEDWCWGPVLLLGVVSERCNVDGCFWVLLFCVVYGLWTSVREVKSLEVVMFVSSRVRRLTLLFWSLLVAAVVVVVEVLLFVSPVLGKVHGPGKGEPAGGGGIIVVGGSGWGESSGVCGGGS